MSVIFINRQIHLGIGYALLIAVFLGSLLSLSIPHTQYVSHTDKFFHAFAYAVLGLWFAQVIPLEKHSRLFAALFLYGALIELIQTALPYRSGSVLDLAANSSGLLFAMFWVNFVKNRAQG